MADLLLRTRVAALEANVQRVRRLLVALKNRKEGLDELARMLTEQQRQAAAIVDGLQAVRRRLMGGEQEGLELLRQTEVAANEFEYQFAGRSAKVAALDRARANIFQGETMGLGAAIATEMERRPRAILTTLGDIQEQLAAGQGGSQQAWTTYGERVHAQAQSYFAEYVDLIAGLALRNVGFDEGVCQLADELMSSYQFNTSKHYDLYALPSRQKAVSMTWARIIRLGGPEWSLWALPFAGHEFWHVIIAGHFIDAERTVKDIDVSSPQMQECLADAFATYAMGPAYAYACVLLRLDPCSAFTEDGEHAADDTRAHAIFTMLEQMDGVRPDAAPYADLRRDLLAEWNQAVGYVRPPGMPQTERKEQLSTAIQGVFHLLQEGTTGGFSVDAWHGIQQWPEKLVSADAEIAVSPAHELRQVINAAWLARLRYPAMVPEIARRTEDLWKSVVKKTQNLSGQTRSRQPDVPRPARVGT
jgi:hypothetical protein